MTQPQAEQHPVRPPISIEALSLIVGGLDDLHHLTESMARGEIALLFLDEETRHVTEMVILGTIARAYTDDTETLYIDPLDTAARARYGTIHHELRKLRAWTGHGRQCVPIIDWSGMFDDLIAPFRRSLPDAALTDYRVRT